MKYLQTTQRWQSVDCTIPTVWLQPCYNFHQMNWVDLHSSVDAVEELAEEYVFHRLKPAENRRYKAHLVHCDRCREAVETVDQFIEAFKVGAHPQRARSVA